MTDLTCEELKSHLTDFLAGSLPDDIVDAGLEHLATCEQCTLVVDETRKVIAYGAAHGPLRLDDETRKAIRAMLEAGVK